MRLFNKILVVLVAVAFVFGLAGLARATLAPGAVDLGTADNFAVFADDAITDASPPTGIITGDVGLTPTTGAGITGLTCPQVTGTIYDVDNAYGGLCEVANAGLLTLADNDLSTAYNVADALVPLPDIPTELGGTTLSPGIYHSAAGTFAITGGTTLTLDGGGDPDAVFIFQTDSTLITTGASNSVVLTDGAQACNVFWKVGSSATLDTTTTFVGTIMAAVSITDAGGSTVVGRLLADADETDVPETGAVTLNNTDVTVPTCAPSLTLNKTVVNTGGGTALDTAWTLTATGAGGSPTNLSGTDPVDSNVTFADATFEADTYTLAESGGPADYTASTYSCVTNGGGAVVSNSITLAAGDDAVCTITNTYVPPSSSGGSSSGSSRRTISDTATLRVIKRVVNNNGGTATSSDFTLFVKEDGDNVTGSPKAGTTSGTLYRLSAGTYVVSENVDARYTQRFSGDCSANGTVTLSAGDTETCTITNDDVSAVVIPSLPNTGLPPEDNATLWLVVVGILASISIVFYVVQKKRIA